MSDPAARPSLDFDVLPIARASDVLRRVGGALVADLLARRPLTPVATLLEGEDVRLMAAARAQTLHRHALAAGLKRGWWHRRQPPRPPDLRTTALAWRQGSFSPQESKVQLLERIEQGYAGIDERRLALPFWPLAAIRAWGDLAFQYEVAAAGRAVLRKRVLLSSHEMKALYTGARAAPLLSPQFFWLLLAAADTCRDGRIWRPGERRRRRAAAQLQAIADELAYTAAWAGFWEQWLLLELASQDKRWSGHLSMRLQAAVAALPIFQAFPEYKPAPVQVSTAAEVPGLANWAGEAPGWVRRLYAQTKENEEHGDEQERRHAAEQGAEDHRR